MRGKASGTFQGEIQRTQKALTSLFRDLPDEMGRYENITAAIAHDHTDRWLWELLQNCDDARASEVLIYASSDYQLVLIADNGEGFKPQSIDAIRGGFLSDKLTKQDTIGYKGIGFKSVYTITDSPRIVVVSGEGVYFDKDVCVRWLQENNLSTENVPYAWIPFLYTWDDAVKTYPFLEPLCKGYTTVVILPYKKPEIHEKLLRGLDAFTPYSIINFRNVRHLRVVVNQEERNIFVNVQEKNLIITDAQGNQVKQEVFRKSEYKVPGAMIDESLLTHIEGREVERLRNGNVPFAVACSVNGECIAPFQMPPNLHIFYPTEHPAPVPLLLHAGFRTKSDRTAIVPLEEDPLNDWIARQLAKCVVDYVKQSYNHRFPNLYLQLIDPLPVGNDKDMTRLQEYIFAEARSSLLLPNTEGKLSLRVDEAIFIPSDFPLPAQVRQILQKTPTYQFLVHHSIDDDKKSQLALRKLGVRALTNQDVLESIREYVSEYIPDYEWLWACWLYLSELVQDKQYTQAICQLPIIPLSDGVYSYQQLKQKIVSLPTEETEDLPEWIGVVVIAPEFAKRVKNHEEEVEALLRLLKIQKVNQSELIGAIGKSIEAFWKEGGDNPYQFLSFIVHRAGQRKWKAQLSELRDCPVPVYDFAQHRTVPAKAHEVYFPDIHDTLNIAELCEGLRDWQFLSREREIWQQILAKSEVDPNTRMILSQIGVREFDPDKVEKVLRDGIREFWTAPEGDPYRFIRFILREQENSLIKLDIDNLGNCPVPAYIGASNVPSPLRAEEAYFDAEIDGIMLSSLFSAQSSASFICLNPEVWQSITDDQAIGEDVIISILKRLGVQTIPSDEIVDWLCESIKDFWQNEEGDPYRFFRFIYKASCKGIITDIEDILGACPVPAYKVDDPEKNLVPVRAEDVYFGADWKHTDLEDFYRSLNPTARVRDIYFLCSAERLLKACQIGDEEENLRELLYSLGVSEFPSLYVEQDVSYNQLLSSDYPECSESWKELVFSDIKNKTVGKLVLLKGVKIERLQMESVVQLISFIYRHWEEYYSHNCETRVTYTHDRSKSPQRVDACWWHDLKHLSRVPTKSGRRPEAPSRCWMPGSEVEKLLGWCLPILDIEKFCSDKKTQEDILKWLIQYLGVRHSFSQMDDNEWKAILKEQIPRIFRETAQKQQDKRGTTDVEENGNTNSADSLGELIRTINRIYEQFLQWRSERGDDRSEVRYDDCPLVCVLGKSGEYILARSEQDDLEPIYLNDHPKYAKHFDTVSLVLVAATDLKPKSTLACFH